MKQHSQGAVDATSINAFKSKLDRLRYTRMGFFSKVSNKVSIHEGLNFSVGFQQNITFGGRILVGGRRGSAFFVVIST